MKEKIFSRRVGSGARKPTCPFCHSINDGLTGLGNHLKGDFALCVNCGRCSVIEVKPFRLRKPRTEQEKADCNEVELDLY